VSMDERDGSWFWQALGVEAEFEPSVWQNPGLGDSDFASQVGRGFCAPTWLLPQKEGDDDGDDYVVVCGRPDCSQQECADWASYTQTTRRPNYRSVPGSHRII
jgi:hypothetical protein